MVCSKQFVFSGHKLARYQGGFETMLHDDQELASAVLGQTFGAPGRESTPPGSPPRGIAQDCLAVRTPLKEFPGKVLGMSPSAIITTG